MLSRTRVSHIVRVAQERSDAAASTVPSSTERPAGSFITGIDNSSSQLAAGSAASAGFPGFSESQHLNGHGFGGALQGLPVTEPLDRAAAAAVAANGADAAADAIGNIDQHAANGTPSSSGSHADEDLSYISSGLSNSSRTGPGSSSGYMGRQWAGASSSDASSSGAGSQSAWQPPTYRRSGLRLRSKRILQTAEKLQQSGRNLIADELQAFMTASTSSREAAEDHDEHLEAFIEQMLCPKTSVWKRSETAPATTDSREAVDADVLANIHTMPLEQVQQQQAKLVGRGQLQAALVLLEEAAAAGRRDVLQQTSHKEFLRAAGGLVLSSYPGLQWLHA